MRMYWYSDHVPALSSAVVYGAISLSIGFLNKAVVSEYEFNFPLFILGCQMMLTLCVLEILQLSGKFSLPVITFASIRMFALPSFCYSLHATLSLVALEGMNIPMYAAVKRCTPLVNLILSVTYLKKPVPSPMIISSVLIITVGCLIAGMSDPTFNAYAYMMGGMSVVLQGLYLTLVQQCGENNLSPIHVLHLHSYISVIPFFILTYSTGEISAMWSYRLQGELGFVGIFLLLLVMGLLLNFSLFLCTMLNSALTTSIVGVSKAFLGTIIGFYAFGGIPYHPVNIAGIVLNTIGGFVYTYAKYKEQRKQRRIDIGDTGIQQNGWELKTKLQPVR